MGWLGLRGLTIELCLSGLKSGFFERPVDLSGDDDSKLHQLDIYGDGFLKPEQFLEPITDVSSESQADVNPAIAEDATDKLDDDIGLLDRLDGDVVYKSPLRSWEAYQDRAHKEPVSAYFSESEAKGFDAALACHAASGKLRNAGRLVRSDVFLQALIRLGLGWSSAFFRYNKEGKKFERVLENIRISGVSLPVFNQTIDEMIQCGTDMQRVRTFVHNTPAKTVGLSALSTFASTLAVITYTLERQLATHARHAISLLQIKTLFRRGGEMMSALADLMDAVEKASSDAQVLSVVMGRALYLTQRFGWIEKLMREIVVRVTEPWLGYMEGWIGLRPETPVLSELISRGRGFAALEHHEKNKGPTAKAEPANPQYKYQSKQMPSFIPADQAQLIFESGKSLRFLKRSHPRHPLSGLVSHSAEPPRLRYADSWADIERVQTKAHEYEASLRTEILKYNRGEPVGQAIEPEFNFDNSGYNAHSGTQEDTYDLFDMDDEQHMTGLLTDHASLEKDKLGRLSSSIELSEDSQDSQFAPELTSALYLSLAPLLSSQALLIDFSCLHILFKEHGIRNHLTLQWRFQLLGDGYFTSRLSSALFDPEMENGERKSSIVPGGVHTGLRLGSRDTWPPASSELRLALIGLLSESHNASEGPTNDTEPARSRKGQELPGGLSFAIRELPAEEVPKCKDPNSIQALDFLRLHYKPPGVLEIILTSQSLDKYDSLFKHLLRLLRMVSVVKNLVRDSTARKSLSGDTRNVFQKFRIDAQHFIFAVSDYCFHVGVGSTWNRFQETLSRIEHCLDSGDIDGTIDAAHSVPRLREYHEEILDEMLFSLFLSKRHVQAAKVLDSIFDIILNFAPISRMDGVKGVRQESESTVAQLYSVFRKQASAFVGYLRSLDGSRASSKRSLSAFASQSGPTSIFDHLLVRLDMNGYY